MKVVETSDSENKQSQNTQQQRQKIANLIKQIRQQDVDNMSLKELVFLHKYSILTKEEKSRVKKLRAAKTNKTDENKKAVEKGDRKRCQKKVAEKTSTSTNKKMPTERTKTIQEQLDDATKTNNQTPNRLPRRIRSIANNHSTSQTSITMIPDDFDEEDIDIQRYARKTLSNIKSVLAQPIVLISVIILILILLIPRSYLVPSGSMKPTLNEGNRIMTTVIFFPTTDSVEKGDIICFHPPHKPMEVYVKRVIGKPGDRIQISGNDIYVNGEISPYGKSGGVITSLDTTVSEGHLWMAGDNGTVSEDSRYWGELPEENIISKVHAVWWPISEFKWLSKIDNTTIYIALGIGFVFVITIVFTIVRKRKNKAAEVDDEDYDDEEQIVFVKGSNILE